ncbi:MAG: hypothetical protein GEU83_09475 [Pseudonocardiaceae bacterium]|nr:hypothetical protein [Pseudonocardiaceae bacterium]
MVTQYGPSLEWQSSADPSLAGQSERRATRSARADDAEALSIVAATYLEWGWPVTVSGNRVLLAVGAEVIAIALPTGLTAAVVAILDDRRCPAPVLTDPRAPTHQVLLACEPFGAPLPWPTGTHLVSGTVTLPPSTTPLGPVTWQRAPAEPELPTCREIDIFGAVCTTMRAPDPSGRAVQ